MAKTTLVFGVVLAAMGIGFFVATGSAHPTSLIPTWFGLALIVCGVLANTEDARRRMIWMHVAVTVALIGFVVPAVRVVMAIAKSRGGPVAHADALAEQGAMAGLCLVLTAACVRSFIAARRGSGASDSGTA